MIRTQHIGQFALPALLVSALLIAPANADFPEGPIELTVSYGSGGSSDLAARTFATHAEKHFDGTFVVQNRPGAGGIVGSEHVYQSDPDGHSLLLGRIATLAVGPAMQDVPYDVSGFTYVGLLSTDPFACVTGANQPYESLQDLADAIEAQPGAITYNSSGVGSFNQFATLRILETLGIENPETAATHVPDEGEGPALSAVVGGHIHFFCGNVAPMLNQIQAGQVRALLVTTQERLDSIPDVPTVGELGYPELEELVGWSAIVGPPEMDPEALDVLTDVMAAVADDAEWQETVRELGSVPDIRPPEETKEFADRQREGFREMAERFGLRD